VRAAASNASCTLDVSSGPVTGRELTPPAPPPCGKPLFAVPVDPWYLLGAQLLHCNKF
jgi:hypothetical protein